MSRRLVYAFLSLGCLLTACRGVPVQTPTETITRPAKQTLAQKKLALSQKKKQATQLPEVLGGIVKSDEWIIYKDKEQEEFSGHVFYDNGAYTFQSNYALSDRKNHTFTASGNVYAKQKDAQNTVYEAYADYARYNYQTGKGLLKSTTKKPVRLILTEAAQTVTAQAKQITFDTNQQIFVLTGNVDAKRTTPEGTQTIRAQKATLKQLEDYLLLEGNAVLADDLRTLQADTVIYDGAHNQAHAYGARPLATGSTEQGTFAIIADTISSDAQGNVVTLDGKVQGWLVSPELNNNKINTKF